jgi:hypothetical protein
VSASIETHDFVDRERASEASFREAGGRGGPQSSSGSRFGHRNLDAECFERWHWRETKPMD